MYCTKALGEVEVGARFRFRGNWCVGRPFGVIVPMVPLAGERAACKQWISDSAQEHMIGGLAIYWRMVRMVMQVVGVNGINQPSTYGDQSPVKSMIIFGIGN